MLEQLGITALRPGPSGNEQAPNHANVDEATATPFPDLPDALTSKNGQRVTTPGQWWHLRRPEIVEDFEREVYGRVPAERAGGDVVGGEEGRGGRRRRARRRAAARGARRQCRGTVDHRRHRPRARHAGGGQGACAADDHVPQGKPAAAARRTAAAARPMDAAARTRRRSTRDRAADRRRLGLCVPGSGKHAGRQRRRADARDHRSGEQGTAPQARGLGRAARVGMGRGSRARLPRDRPGGGRQASRHRGRLALRQGRARHDGLRAALRGRARRLLREGRRQAAPAQLRRGRREPHRLGRVPLDGGQLPQIRRADVSRRQQERRRPSGRLRTS